MCTDHNHEPLTDASLYVDPEVLRRGVERGCVWTPDEVAGVLAEMRQLRSPHVGWVGYGGVQPGQNVLIGIDRGYDPEVANAVAKALRHKGATVDIITLDSGDDREYTATEEIDWIIRNRPYRDHPRRWDGVPWLEELAAERYDLLIHRKGGGTRETRFGYEQIPFLKLEHLTSGAGIFPQDLNRAINMKTWDGISRRGRGGKVHLTDPEGTDLTWTLHDEYYRGNRRGFVENPVRHYGHLHGHPPAPLIEQEDCTGVVGGSTSHAGRPFPNIRLHIDGGRLERVEGGGEYGRRWDELLRATKNVQYPSFPRKGLFWMWESAIGTLPWIRRPEDVQLISSGGFEWERRRSGVIHIGIGTRWNGEEEYWAADRGMTYGHLHVHLLFPTFEIETVTGEKFKLIENGRLTALDDPEIREIAARYADPDLMLKEYWIPQIPGISAPGDYADYARNPEKYVYAL